MESQNEHYRERTKRLALKVIGLADNLLNKPSAWVMAKQIIRSATSVAANYRAMCLGRSQAERYAKLCIVVEESDETVFWIEMLLESALVTPEQVADILPEATILAKTFTAYRAKLKE